MYFKKVYTKEYQKTKESYLKATTSIELPGEYMIGIVNDITEIMSRAEVMGKIKVRKKSYFSLYNKMQRKDYNHFSNSIGVRIIFDKKGDLKKFVKKFEGVNMCLKKKDYIQKPKSNGYQSIHYMYPSFYRIEILVELQLRTKQMDNLIRNIRTISHFDYTVKENKWSDLFSEVIDGYEYTMKIIEQEKEKELHKHEQSSKKTSS